MCSATRFVDNKKLCTGMESSNKTQDKTTIQKAHQHAIGAISPCIKEKCGCKFGHHKKGSVAAVGW